MFGCVLFSVSEPHARSLPSIARIVWSRGDRLYLAAPDSGALAEGRRLELFRGRKPVATARVIRVIDGTLAVARVESGSIAGIKRLERLHVLATPATHETPSILRLGIPSERRPSLLFACPEPTFAPPASAGAYRLERLGSASLRWVRTSPGSGEPAWPDTLVVQRFDDAGDEEIAFERGELDLAMFWPGEVSPRFRDAPLRESLLLGLRGRGVIAAQLLPRAGVPDSSFTPLGDLGLTTLNARLFRGDLVPWPALEGVADSASGRRRPDRVRFRVDASMPGARAIERLLNEGAPSSGAQATPVRLLFLNTPVQPAPVVARSLRDLGVSPQLAIRCAVLCRPSARPFVLAVGISTLVGRWACDASELEP